MNRKAATALLLVVALPLVALAWLGWRGAERDELLAAQRDRDLVQARLQEIEGLLLARFQGHEKALLAASAGVAASDAELAAYAGRQPWLEQIFVMRTDGTRSFPREPLSGREADFLRRSAAFWRNHDILWQGGQGGGSAAGEAEPSRYGWYVWYADAEQNHVFWWRDPAGRLLGFALDPARLLADLIAALPVTPAEAGAAMRTRLVMPSGSVLYEWGSYAAPAGQAPTARRALAHPLDGWRLDHYAAPPAVAVAGRLGPLAGLAALALAVAGLGSWLWREQQRESRLAQQRVSFVNQVSHELKTPLTNIRMYAELLDGELDDAEATPRRYVDVITAESRRLSRLIANVLDFARLQREAVPLRPRPARVDEVIEACLAAFAPAFAGKGIAVEFAPGGGPAVQLDVEVLEQILNNLLGNVEKYAAAGGRVQLASSVEGGDCSVVRVRDFGPGVAGRDRDRIFEAFYRAGGGLGEGATGTGIGLTLARELARRHGGELRLLAVEGPGACFEVRLRTPSCPAPSAEGAAS